MVKFTDKDVDAFNKRIKLLCVEMDITPAELADRCGISRTTFYNTLNRSKFHPRADIVFNICKVLNVSFDYIMTGKERASVEDPAVTAILNVPQLRRIVEKLNTLPRNKLDAIEGVFMGFFNIANQNDQEFMAAEPSGKYG